MATPICRCRVLYLGSAVPHVTKDGLHGIQEPLRELYPEEGVLGARGIDSWLSVWSNGLLLENVDEKHKRVTRFFPIESLHYCAAVRHVTIPGADGDRLDRFLPLDSPFARVPSVNNPPLFGCIMRRTSGIKVLECHSFVCKKEMAANALVRCCFHSYADNMYARHLDTGPAGSIYGSVICGGGAGRSQLANGNGSAGAGAGSNGSAFVNPIQKVEQWRAYVNHLSKEDADNDNGELVSIYDGDENHKVWAGGVMSSAGGDNDQNSIYAADYMSTLRSSKSVGLNTTQRSNRPRQLTAPSSPPPPPPPNKNKNMVAKANNNKKAAAAAASRDKSHRSNFNNNYGHGPSNGGPRTFQASEFRPVWPLRLLQHPHQGVPVSLIGGGGGGHAPHMIMPPGNLYRKVPKNMKGVVSFPPRHPPPMSYSPMPLPLAGPAMRSTEEPIYLPSYPPKSLPGQFYGGQQSPPPPPGHPINKPQTNSSPLSNIQPPSSAQKSPKGKKVQKKINNSTAAAAASTSYDGNSRPNVHDKGSDSESKFNTGIYKKGHLNERAFSYSIRQEHRSRSHNSLSTLNFNEPTSVRMIDREADDHHQSSSSIMNGAQNSKASAHPERKNGHANEITNGSTNGNSNFQSLRPAQSKSKRDTSDATSSSAGVNGVNNAMNDLSLTDSVLELEEMDSGRHMNPVSRRRIVAAANSHR